MGPDSQLLVITRLGRPLGIAQLELFTLSLLLLLSGNLALLRGVSVQFGTVGST